MGIECWGRSSKVGNGMGSIARLAGVCLAARNNTCVKADFHRMNMGEILGIFWNWEMGVD